MKQLIEVADLKACMNFGKARCCSSCGNARLNPGNGGMGDGFLECNANVVCRFRVDDTMVCDHYDGSHGPTSMPH